MSPVGRIPVEEAIHPLLGPRLADVLNDIAAERQRQEEIGRTKRAAGIDWRSCADPEMAGGDDRRFAVLGEEFGEVARAVLERDFASAGSLRDGWERSLRTELIQVAAVAAAWVEAIDRRAAR